MFSKKNKGNIAFILIFAALFAMIFIAVNHSDRKNSEKYAYSSDFFAMDTVVSVRSQSDVSEDVKKIFSEYQSALDCNSESGETYRLNSGEKFPVSDKLLQTIQNVFRLNDEYGSLTDITAGRLTALWNVTGENPSVPEESLIRAALETVGRENIVISGNEILLKNNTSLDFGAVGKGAALDSCFEYLRTNNCGKTFVSTGSSVLLYGSDSFDVGITNPSGNGVIAEVKTEQCFLSTSGGYERYFEADGKTWCHITDPRTGYPTETDLTTVTVFCHSGIESDFLSTMIFIDGSQNIEKYLHSDKYKVFAADKNKNVYASDGLDYEVCDDTYRK